VERALFSTEITLAFSVFQATIPYHMIRIKSDFGLNDRAWCEPGVFGHFILHMGPVGFAGCWQSAPITPLGAPTRNVFIHELVHAWQGSHGLNYVLGSLASQCTAAFTGGNAYTYTVGSSWPSYNCEQQGNIVEDWFANGLRTTDARYRYIRDNIRKGLIAP
jgi:hypothetical protein